MDVVFIAKQLLVKFFCRNHNVYHIFVELIKAFDTCCVKKGKHFRSFLHQSLGLLNKTSIHGGIPGEVNRMPSNLTLREIRFVWSYWVISTFCFCLLNVFFKTKISYILFYCILSIICSHVIRFIRHFFRKRRIGQGMTWKCIRIIIECTLLLWSSNG